MKKHSIIITTIFLILLISCTKFVDVPEPKDQVSSTQVFTSDTKAIASVNSIYAQMINGGATSFSKQILSAYCGLSSDEMSRYNATIQILEFINNDILSTNGTNRNLWATLYQTIYYANACKEGLENSIEVSEQVKQNLLAEVKFVRAFCHFYLVNLYGDVPIIVTTDYNQNALISRSPVATVYEQIIRDLTESENYLSSDYEFGERIKPTKWAAKSFLSRVYLYLKNWSEAERKSTEVIATGLFTPLPVPNTVFLKNSKEAIWQLKPNTGILPEIRETRPSGNVPKVYIAPSLINTFSNTDLRKKQWVDSVLNGGTYFFYPSKYKNTSATVTEYYMMLRCAEQFLIRAEARCQLDNITGAIDDLNVLRIRAGLTMLPHSMLKEQVTQAIEIERQHELFSELNHRWFDLKRTVRLSTVLAPIKSGWQNTDSLYPIPSTEILRNPNMVQNPGY